MCSHCEGISGHQSITYCAEQKRKRIKFCPRFSTGTTQITPGMGSGKTKQATEEMAKQNNGE